MRARRGLTLLLSAFLWALPTHAQTAKEDSRNARLQLDRLRQMPGILDDRCDIGAWLSEQSYVVRLLTPDSPLQLGDRVVSINGHSLEQGPRSYFEVTAGIAPDAKVQVGLARGGDQLEVTLSCINARPFSECDIWILDAMSKRRWEDCLSIVARCEKRSERTAQLAFHRYVCGFHAGSYRHSAQEAAASYEWLRLLMEEAQWDTAYWLAARTKILSSLGWFERHGHLHLSGDLRQQVSAIDRDRSEGAAGSAARPPVAVGKTGTGFLVSSSGAVVTNHHVVQGAREISVRCGSRRQPTSATVRVASAANDLAVLDSGLASSEYLSLAPPRTAGVGQRVFTFGFPVTSLLGEEPKFTEGSISAMSGVGGEQAYMQISVPLQPGNSGGPLVNERGEVVGVVAAVAAVAPFVERTGTLPQNVNWAVKSEYAGLLLEESPAQPPTTTREEAIARARSSICFVEAR